MPVAKIHVNMTIQVAYNTVNMQAIYSTFALTSIRWQIIARTSALLIEIVLLSTQISFSNEDVGG